MLKEIIYDYFLEKSKKEKKGKKGINFAPSYLNACKRQIAYKKINIDPSNPLENHAYVKFEMGNAVHESIQTVLQKKCLWIEGEDFKEIEWYGLEWMYRIDGKIKIKEKEYICEIKTVYNTGYKSIEEKAKPEHELQLLMYMLFEKVENGMILYIGRDNGFMIEYNYTLDKLFKKYQEFLLNKTKELAQLKADIENKVIPMQDYNICMKNNNGIISFSFQKDKIKYKTDWQCSYCQWKSLCWENELKEIQNHKYYYNREFVD